MSELIIIVRIVLLHLLIIFFAGRFAQAQWNLNLMVNSVAVSFFLSSFLSFFPSFFFFLSFFLSFLFAKDTFFNWELNIVFCLFVFVLVVFPSPFLSFYSSKTWFLFFIFYLPFESWISSSFCFLIGVGKKFLAETIRKRRLFLLKCFSLNFEWTLTLLCVSVTDFYNKNNNNNRILSYSAILWPIETVIAALSNILRHFQR